MRIQIGYTPNADDVYMLQGLLGGHVEVEGLDLLPQPAPQPVLNDLASRCEHEVTMISAAAYAFVADRYAILPAGASFGLDGVGPVIVAREPITEAELYDRSIAIPGATTTAFALLQIYKPTLRTRVLPFSKLLPAVETGLVDCALAIHEEFVTYRQFGLEVVASLGKWWSKNHPDVPMPVTVCCVRRDLPADVQARVAEAVGQSVTWARANHAEAMVAALANAPDCDPMQMDAFVRQYVNDLSVDMGRPGLASLETFFNQTARARILPPCTPLELVEATVEQV